MTTEGERVLVSASGFWSSELAGKLVPAVVRELDQCGGRCRLELDLTALRPLREEGQAAFRNLFNEAISRSPEKIFVRSASAIAKLQMMRLARNIGKEDQVIVE